MPKVRNLLFPALLVTALLVTALPVLALPVWETVPVAGPRALATALSDDPDPPALPQRTRLSTVIPAPELGAGLVLRDGRTLHHGPRSLMNRFPYLVAANPAELAEGFGYELTARSVPALLEPISSPEGAVRLTRWLIGGNEVPDRAAFDRLLAVARAADLPEDSWPVKIEPFVPTHFPLAATPEGAGFVVRGTILTCSADDALSVIEVTVRIPNDGPVTIDRAYAIIGPPQSWQTSGEVDREEQARLSEAIQQLRDDLLAALYHDLTLEPFRALFAKEPRWHEIRFRVGEPNRVVGSGRSFGLYRLGDGNVVLVPHPDGRREPGAASVHASWNAENGPGTLIETLRPPPTEEL